MTNLFSLVAVVLLFEVSALAVCAATNNTHSVSVTQSSAPEKVIWEEYTYPGEEFSVRLPVMPGVFRTQRSIKGSLDTEPAHLYSAYVDNIVYVIFSYDKPRREETLDYFIAEFGQRSAGGDMTLLRATNLNGVESRRYALNLQSRGVNGAAAFFLTPKHAYMVKVLGADESHDSVRRFLDSFTLSKKPTGKVIADDSDLSAIATTQPPVPNPVAKSHVAPRTPMAGEAVPALSLPENQPKTYGDPKSESTVPVAGGGIGTGEGGGIGLGRVGNTGSGDVLGKDVGPVDYVRTFKQNEVTQKAWLVTRPEPGYTEEARRNNTSGTVKLRGVLSSSGKVTMIAVIKGLPDGLTEKGIHAFRHISFFPALKDGRRVSQYVLVEYVFNIYLI